MSGLSGVAAGQKKRQEPGRKEERKEVKAVAVSEREREERGREGPRLRPAEAAEKRGSVMFQGRVGGRRLQTWETV